MARVVIDINQILQQVITLIGAVSSCMISVALLVNIVHPRKQESVGMPYVKFQEPTAFPTNILLMNSFGNAFSFLAMVMIVNCTLVLLYKGGHTSIIKGWLMTGSGLLLSVTSYHYLGRIMQYINTPLDVISTSVVVYNLAMTGLTCLYYKGPFLLHQGYMIYVSVLMALILEESFPEWTSWILLILISFWDIFAVLCVVGPLKILLDTAKERNEPLFPALVFSTSSAWCYGLAGSTLARKCNIPMSLQRCAARCHNQEMPSWSSHAEGDDQVVTITKAMKATPNPASQLPGTASPAQGVVANTPAQSSVPGTAGSAPTNARGRTHTRTPSPRAHSTQRGRSPELVCRRCHRPRALHRDSLSDADRGMKMGLGDFVFYSVLMGSAARNATVGVVLFCYVFIIVGILLTMSLLLLFQQPLPALPISIGLGTVAYFSSSYFVELYLQALYYVGL